MSDGEIKTQSVGRGVAKTNPIKLGGTPETRIQFLPTVHDKGVSGSIIKYRKDKKTEWSSLGVNDFKNHALEPMEKIEIPISTAELKKLVEEVQSREDIAKDGIRPGVHEYITVEKDKVVVLNDKNKKELLEQILNKGYSDDFWTLLSGAAPEVADKLTAGHLQMQRRKILTELKDRLTKSFPETIGNSSWQKWIFNNNWLFGPNYQEPIEKQKINIVGIMPDFLFPTIDGFFDILEIKLPNDSVIETDPSHAGSWMWSKNSNIAIGQVVNYLGEVERLRLEIERQIKLKYGKEFSLLKPRAFILIGNSETWSVEKKEALRKLNHWLHGIEVITYFDLTQRGETFLGSSFPGLSPSDVDDDDNPF